jgi:YVTN family beta-propeller protein
MRASAFVGRVGGLAVAFGIGVATGGLGVASASPSDPADSTATVDSAASTGSGAQAPATRSRTARTSRPARGVGDDRDARGAVTAPAATPSPTRLAGDERNSATAISSAVGVDRAMSALMPRSARSVVTRRAAVAQPIMGELVSSVAPAAAADMPQMVATPAQPSAADAVEVVWSPLLGSSPGAPTQSPVSWMVLAAARRQFGPNQVSRLPVPPLPTTALVSTSAPMASATSTTITPGLAAAVTPTWSPSPLAPIAKVFVGLLLSLGGMNTSTTNPTNPIQQFLYSLAKNINDTFDPAPPAGSPTVSTPDLYTGKVTGTTGFPSGSGLRFTTTQPATGTVTIASDGSFIYAPTLAARQDRNLTTDTFIATVHNGLSTRSVTVTVPVGQETSPTFRGFTFGSPDPITGAVTGTAVYTGAAGRTVVYSTPPFSWRGTPAQGGLEGLGGDVVINSTTGVITYTPTTAQRQAATYDVRDYDLIEVTATYSETGGSDSRNIAVPSSPITNTFQVGSSPHGLALSQDRAYLFVTNTNDNTVSILKTGSPTPGVIKTTPVGGGPSGVAVSTIRNNYYQSVTNGIYITNILDGTVSVLKDWYATPTTISVPGCVGCIGGPGPNAIAAEGYGRPNGSYLFVAKVPPNSTSYGTVSVIDPATAKVITSIAVGPIGTYPQAVAYTNAAVDDGPGMPRLYVTSTGQPGAQGFVSVITLTEDYSAPTLTVTATIPVGTKGNFPQGLVAGGNSGDPNSGGGAGNVYVANGTDGTVSVIDTATNKVTATIKVGEAPSALAISPDGNRVYVANGGSNTVSVINTTTNTVTETIAVGIDPEGVIAFGNGRIYVANAGSNTVSSIPVRL